MPNINNNFDDGVGKLRAKMLSQVAERGVSNEMLRNKHPALKEAYEKYQVLLKLYRVTDVRE